MVKAIVVQAVKIDVDRPVDKCRGGRGLQMCGEGGPGVDDRQLRRRSPYIIDLPLPGPPVLQ